ncbi:alpha/beta fold hydrolase [Streptomyces sp. NBC_00083]|uniref:alpha/beta fold hydrolase n=1 Tax=Streptomyces sp. NBC_00083 TaxID=2975647 RepID=UPI00225807A2|nr:alpha/beta hydrolase [Streptomyces sp. NBC_00083]MCX5383341.1 alpha/beta fold hydrolase [Streptomyces sp. NBC_00083]
MSALDPAAGPLPEPALAAASVGVELLDHDAVPGRTGAGGAPGDLLLLHGFGGDKTQLRPVGDALCGAGSVAVYPSLRAHGDSPKPAWGYSALDFSADLHRFADVLPDELHLVGYSYGGLVAAVSAITWGASRVRSLVVVDQSFDPHPDWHVADEWAEGSLLRWHYDFSHLPDLLERLGIPVLVLAAEGSPNIPAGERERLSRRDSAHFSLAFIEGTHADCHRNTDEITSAMRAFYLHHFGGTNEKESAA